MEASVDYKHKFWRNFDKAYRKSREPCGKAIRTADMQFASTGDNDYHGLGSKRLMRVYKCTSHVIHLTLKSKQLVSMYNTLTKEANEILLQHRTPVFDVINADERETDMKLLESILPARKNTCNRCSQLLSLPWYLSILRSARSILFGRKQRSQFNYRKPFSLGEKPNLVQQAEGLLQEAEHEDIDPAEGAARASTVR